MQKNYMECRKIKRAMKLYSLIQAHITPQE